MHDFEEAVSKIHTDEGLKNLPFVFAGARRNDQRRLVAAVVDHLVTMANDPKRRDDLDRIGARIPSLVLEGTLQQQFFCKVAVRFGEREEPLPPPIVELMIRPKVVGEVVHPRMLAALSDVIRVGAERTRDAAIEGLGALIRLAADAQHPAAEMYPEEVLPDDKRGDTKLNELYKQRLERRRLVVLAVADLGWRQKLVDELKKPIEQELKAVRHKIDSIPNIARDVETVLYRRADLLRVLPAIARQSDVTTPLDEFVDVLCRATRPIAPQPNDSDPILIAYARYQESVFRTIDNMMRRGVHWDHFDKVLAHAVQEIPRTMTGTAAVCNAQVRATVSILRTAIRVVKKSGLASKTRPQLKALFDRLAEEPRPWLNLGIAEACYRGLPDLLSSRDQNDLSRPALDTLFKHLGRNVADYDFASAHRKLIVTSCFRRILIALADDLIENGASADRNDDLRRLLSEPTVDHVIAAFQPQAAAAGATPPVVRNDIHADVIAAIDYEACLLQKAVPLFERWMQQPQEQRLLLARTLASLMHGVSRDAAEIEHYALLRRVFIELSPVAMPHPDAIGRVWDLLAKLPADAASVADPDIQRFVEYRGLRRRGESKTEETVEDLPGHVLAMISRDTSDRIAGAIAREIDLNLRHDRDGNKDADFAEPLYQVILRGPHESIFNHLMPRIVAENDRKMVGTFGKYVSVVLAGLDKPPHELVEYLRNNVDKLLDKQQVVDSPLLTELASALAIFSKLVSDETFWDAVQAHKVGEFFKQLDKLDALASQDKALLKILDRPLAELFKKFDELDKDPRQKDHHHHTLLTHRYARRLLELQAQAKDYVGLRVSNFRGRAELLQKAAATASSIEKELDDQTGLEPPKRVLMIALMAHLADVFERSKRWYCDEAQRTIDQDDKDGFWIVFALDQNRETQLAKRITSWFSSGAENSRVTYKQNETRRRLEQLTKTSGSEPPRFEGQTKRFEDFAVDWMASDLDLEALWNALSDRWRSSYRILFTVVTTPWASIVAIMVPFLWVILCHKFLKVHWLEGLLFGIAATGIVVSAVWALFRLFKVVRESDEDPAARARRAAEQRSRHNERREGYLFRCMLPQLAGCIAAPMALIAEFDHSYQFPFTASGWAVALLLILAFLSTRLYLERQVVDRDSSSAEMTPRERKKITKVLGITLAHSFGIAVLLSIIFADSHYHHSHGQSFVDERGNLVHELADAVAHTEGTELVVPQHEELRDFIHLVPHQAFFQVKGMTLRGYEWCDAVQEHLNYTYYPTIILSWTALGLFFGFVLEGIGKGERLRHRGSRDSHG